MNNVFSGLLSLGGGGLALVGEQVIKITDDTIRIVQTNKPNILMIDLSSIDSMYSFTLGNLLTFIGISCAVLGASLGLYNFYTIWKEKKRSETFPDSVVKKPKKKNPDRLG